MKKFTVLWSSQAASLLGSAVVQFALAWYLTRETGSATVLASALMVAMLPQVVLGPLVGPLVDRWDRKKIMIFSDLFTSLMTVVLVVLFALHSVQVWHIYLLMVGRSIGDTFQGPALIASFPMLVPKEQLVRANGLFQMLRDLIRVVAPVAGAFLMETLPMTAVLSVDIVTAVIAVAVLLPLGIRNPARDPEAARRDYLADLREGFKYIWARRGIATLIGMFVLLIFTVAPASNLFPVLVNEHLEGDVAKLGWMISASGVGGIAGGLLLGVWPGFKRRLRTAYLGFLVMIPASVAVGLTTPATFYTVTMPAMFFLGASGAVAFTPLNAILNAVVADDMQGRVFSLQGSIVGAAIPLGLLIGGPVADTFGIRSLYFIAAGAWLLIASGALLSKSLLELENGPATETPAAERSPT